MRTTGNRGNGKPTVSVFEFDEISSERLNVRTFEKPNSEWLRYIAINRTGAPLDDGFDIVIGPVANDQAIRTVNNYLSGYLSEEFAIKLLLPQKLKDQYVFRTEESFLLLRFEEARLV